MELGQTIPASSSNSLPTQPVSTENSSSTEQKTNELVVRRIPWQGFSHLLDVVTAMFGYLGVANAASCARVSKATNEFIQKHREKIFRQFWQDIGGAPLVVEDGKYYDNTKAKYTSELNSVIEVIGKYPPNQIPSDIQTIINGDKKFLIKDLQNLRAYCKTRDTLVVWKRLASYIKEQTSFDWTSSSSVKNEAGQFSAWFQKNEEKLCEITYLLFFDLNLQTLPQEIGKFSSLKKLDLSGNRFEAFPESLLDLKSLEVLELQNNRLQAIPAEISRFSNLTKLNCADNPIQTLPSAIGALSKLKRLDLDHTELQFLPPEIGNCKSLNTLFVTDNQLKTLPEEFWNLSSLEYLHLQNNHLEMISSKVGNLSKLLELDLEWNKLQILPQEIDWLPRLHKLGLEGNPWNPLTQKIKDWLKTSQLQKQLDDAWNSLP